MADELRHRRCYLAEVYAPRCRLARLTAETERIRQTAEELAASGAHVRYLHSVFLPEEEIVLHVFESVDAELVEQVFRAAGVDAERVNVAVTTTPVAGREVLA